LAPAQDSRNAFTQVPDSFARNKTVFYAFVSNDSVRNWANNEAEHIIAIQKTF